MKIGIISDTHDNIRNVIKAVLILQENKVDLVIHCGDIISPAVIPHFEGLKTVFIRGNNDGDPALLRERISEIGGEFFDDIAELELGGKKFAIYHGQIRSRLDDLIESGRFDYILTGHTHTVRDDSIGGTRVLNPGAHFWNCENTIMILDTSTNEVELIDIWQEEAEEI